MCLSITTFKTELFEGWSQNRVKIFYLYNVKISLAIYPLPLSIFTSKNPPTPYPRLSLHCNFHPVLTPSLSISERRWHYFQLFLDVFLASYKTLLLIPVSTCFCMRKQKEWFWICHLLLSVVPKWLHVHNQGRTKYGSRRINVMGEIRKVRQCSGILLHHIASCQVLNPINDWIRKKGK